MSFTILTRRLLILLVFTACFQGCGENRRNEWFVIQEIGFRDGKWHTITRIRIEQSGEYKFENIHVAGLSEKSNLKIGIIRDDLLSELKDYRESQPVDKRGQFIIEIDNGRQIIPSIIQQLQKEIQ